jgi:hypothetical protein
MQQLQHSLCKAAKWVAAFGAMGVIAAFVAFFSNGSILCKNGHFNDSRG